MQGYVGDAGREPLPSGRKAFEDRLLAAGKPAVAALQEPMARMRRVVVRKPHEHRDDPPLDKYESPLTLFTGRHADVLELDLHGRGQAAACR